ncbi:MAG TPA: NUDIX hydrolase [Candidatus Acidoferrales bacterium]|nr:NUDIX hydrolase [Candidatus Acidoferrales bacterium]
MPAKGREYPERPVVGVGGIVISSGRVLLVRRVNAPLAGDWSIPGGAVEPGEPLAAAVRRELAEETGTDVRVLSVVEVFERIDLDAAGKPRFHFVVLDYLCELLGGEPRAGSDVGEIAWASQADLRKFALAPAALEAIRKAFLAAGSAQRGAK